MARGGNVEERTILQMALVGYRVEKEKIEKRIYELQSLLRGKRTASPSVVARIGHSPARSRIAAAQRRRWAEHRRLKARAAKAK
jgi:hypothetical protein